MKKWKQRDGDHTFVRQFGPIKATICRKWHLSPAPTEYCAFLSVGEQRFSVGEQRFSVSIADLGVEWHDDKADAIAVNLLEKQIKKEIRSWLR